MNDDESNTSKSYGSFGFVRLVFVESQLRVLSRRSRVSFFVAFKIRRLFFRVSRFRFLDLSTRSPKKEDGGVDVVDADVDADAAVVNAGVDVADVSSFVRKKFRINLRCSI